jgi:hypothetical protein
MPGGGSPNALLIVSRPESAPTPAGCAKAGAVVTTSPKVIHIPTPGKLLLHMI